MENKETTDKIPTIKEFLDKKSEEIAYIDFYNFLTESKVHRKNVLIPKWIEEYAKLNRDYHLTKHAEVIAEKAQANYVTDQQTGIEIAVVDSQSILQASEEYKQSVK